MRVPIDRGSSIPIYRQVESFIRDGIRSGALGAETQLPSTRALAESLGVSRIVVANAYAELESHALVYSKQGSGTYVAPHLIREDWEAGAISAQDWPLWQQELQSHPWQPAYQELGRLLNSVPHPEPISFAERLAPNEHWPVDDFRKALQSVLRRDGGAAVGQGSEIGHSTHGEAGYWPLRQAVAHILSSQGIPAQPGDVLITSGSQQALHLVANVLLRPRDIVLVESPTYNVAIDLFRSLGVRLYGIPVDEYGMQVERVEEALRTAHPRLIFTVPTFHNPTGTCLTGKRRRKLVRLAHRYSVPILEDDYGGNLRFEGRAQPALKAIDPGGCVIYAGTFSKVLMPGLRQGFLVASGPVFDRLLAAKYVTDLATSEMLQRALHEYVTVGRYHAYLRKTIAELKRRRDSMVGALGRFLPSEVRWFVPQGGRYLWLQLPKPHQAGRLFPLAAEEGVTFIPGSFFFPGKRPQSHLRLNFAINPPEAIEEGVQRLGRAFERLMALVS